MIDPRATRRRLALTIAAVIALLAVFVVRLVDIQLVRADEITVGAEAHRTREVTVYGTRGSIVDSAGNVLADSVERFNITASPRDVDFTVTSMLKDGERVEVSTTEALEAVAELTGSDAADLVTTLQDALAEDANANYALLVKKVKLATFQQVTALGIPWIYTEPNPARTYPQGAVAGNLVGYLGTDGALGGMELTQDQCLASTKGSVVYEAGADGVALPGTTRQETAAKDGGTVTLTIDSDLQWYAQQTLEKEGTKLGADWATAWVVRVSDGHVMAAADWPSVDPNDLNASKIEDLGARSFSSPYEPGSIIKPFTFASLLDAGVITPSEKVTVPDRYTEGLPAGASITDAFPHPEMHWTVAGVLANSSNIGTSMLSTRLKLATRDSYLQGFGFDTKTAVGFLGESAGNIKDPQDVDSITNVAQQFGQGMTATSAQIASAYQALGNDGVHMPLTLVESCTDADGTVHKAKTSEGTRVVSSDAAHQTVKIMEQVVSQGTLADRVDFPGYRVAAKTGTAQVAENGRYGSQRIISVAGLIPAEDPQYAVIVTFAKPDTMRVSSAAAPAFQALADQVIKTFRIAPSSTKSPKIPLDW